MNQTGANSVARSTDLLRIAAQVRGYFVIPIWKDVARPERALTIRLEERATTAAFAADLNRLALLLGCCDRCSGMLPVAGRLLALRTCEVTFGSSLSCEMSRVLLQRAIYALQANGLPESEQWLVLADPGEAEIDSWCAQRRSEA